MAQKLEPLGVETLGVVATDAERARLYFRFRRPRMPMGADPDLTTHRAFGLPNAPLPPNAMELADQAAALELRLTGPVTGALKQLGRHDNYEVSEADHADFDRHQAQFTGQFLIDREGIVRWINVECAREGLDGIDRLPSEEEVLAAARAL